MSRKYEELIDRLQEIGDINAATSVLGWDQQTYMPIKGAEARVRQLTTLSSLAHERLCDPALGELIEELEGDDSLSDDDRAQLRESKRDRDKAVLVPSDLVREIAEVSGHAHHIWAEAREQNDYSLFAPHLKKLIELKTRQAEALGYPEGGQPYDALLDEFEPGATVAALNPVIEGARESAIAATHAIAGSARKPDDSLLKKGYSEKGQKRVCMKILAKMGYDLEAGRLDSSVHPFTTSFDSKDVRITTRYMEHWLPSALFGAIHEGGHALYEQGLPGEFSSTPLGQAISLGIHESQSRFWENQIGRGRAFWTHFYPMIKKEFSDVLGDVDLDHFLFAVNSVGPSMIRVEADEVTYNLHIVVRYEVEQAMFGGQVTVDELPELWNSKMQKYLGLTPANYSEGILQDIHWSFGGFGYFPTYLLGNLYAAQWMSRLREDFPMLDDQIAEGELIPIRDWLKEHIHRQGRRYSADELVLKVTGEKLDPAYFDAYLKKRYGAIYNVSW